MKINKIIDQVNYGVFDVVMKMICERKNPVALANAIESLLKDKSLRIRMGECGYNKFKREFTLDVFEKRFVGILKEIVARNDDIVGL